MPSPAMTARSRVDGDAGALLLMGSSPVRGVDGSRWWRGGGAGSAGAVTSSCSADGAVPSGRGHARHSVDEVDAMDQVGGDRLADPVDELSGHGLVEVEDHQGLGT